MLRALRAAAGRGVKVAIILPEKVDSFLIRHASRSYYDSLMDMGAEIYLYRSGLLHTKSIMVDGAISMFGTVNLDMRSMWLNYEVALFVYDDASFRGRSAELTAELYRGLRSPRSGGVGDSRIQREVCRECAAAGESIALSLTPPRRSPAPAGAREGDLLAGCALGRQHRIRDVLAQARDRRDCGRQRAHRSCLSCMVFSHARWCAGSRILPSFARPAKSTPHPA